MAIVEYGVNIIHRGGGQENPFDKNFDTEAEAVAAAQDLLRDGVERVVLFQLTIIGDTIEDDVTLRHLTRDSFLAEERERLQALRTAGGLSETEFNHAAGTLEAVYEDECVVRLADGARELRCPAYPQECGYVRVVVAGFEVAYWNADEWQESPAEVMGAIMGAAHGHARSPA